MWAGVGALALAVVIGGAMVARGSGKPETHPPALAAALPVTPPPAPVEAAKPTPPSHPAPPADARPGTLVIRVAPWAKISIDGKELGVTPIPVQTLPAGSHQIRLVNDQLKKDITVPFDINPAVENVFKYRL
jgi:hypothetical protein